MLRATLHEQEIRRAIGAPGEGDIVVEGLAPLDANHDRCLYFLNRDAPVAVRESLTARSGCIVIARRAPALAGTLGACRVLEVARPRAAIAKVLEFIKAERRQAPLVPARRIATGAVVSPLSVVEGDVEIGDGVVVEPFCTIGPDARGVSLSGGVGVGGSAVVGADAWIGLNSTVRDGRRVGPGRSWAWVYRSRRICPTMPSHAPRVLKSGCTWAGN